MLKKQFDSLLPVKVSFLFLFFLSASLISFAQQKITVSGTVVSDSSLPLSNVSIRVKGGTAGGTTDENGSFRISVSKGAVLLFSSIGYEEKPVSASTAGAVFTILLQPS